MAHDSARLKRPKTTLMISLHSATSFSVLVCSLHVLIALRSASLFNMLVIPIASSTLHTAHLCSTYLLRCPATAIFVRARQHSSSRPVLPTCAACRARNPTRSVLERRREAMTHPVSQPLLVIVGRGALDSLDRQVSGQSPADEVGDGRGEAKHVEKDQYDRAVSSVFGLGLLFAFWLVLRRALLRQEPRPSPFLLARTPR